ncbi:hypothetical protein ACVMIX_006623 [Rhizobium leguminosarum]
MLEVEWVSATGTLVGGIGTAAGLLYAARQIQLAKNEHVRTEEWRRTEFARSLMDAFSVDEELAFCTRALDWGGGPLIVPAKYRILFEPPCNKFDHNPNAMAAALQVSLNSNWNSPASLVYRYSFDTFFSFLDRIRYYMRTGNIRPEQLIGLEYYFDLIRMPRYIRPDGVEHPLLPFIDRFYPGLSSFIWSVDGGSGIRR